MPPSTWRASGADRQDSSSSSSDVPLVFPDPALGWQWLWEEDSLFEWLWRESWYWHHYAGSEVLSGGCWGFLSSDSAVCKKLREGVIQQLELQTATMGRRSEVVRPDTTLGLCAILFKCHRPACDCGAGLGKEPRESLGKITSGWLSCHAPCPFKTGEPCYHR